MSASVGVSYRRLVLEAAHGASDPDTLRVAAQFAHLLGLELHCLFVEDEAVLALAGLPFAREIRLATHEWRPLVAEQLERELKQEAEVVRRRLEQAVRDLGVSNVFEVLRGDPAAFVVDRCGITDIIAIAAPSAPGARSAHAFGRVHEAALRGRAAVLLLPQSEGRRPRRGAVVAVIAGRDDPVLAVAERIATAAGERLVVLAPAATEAAEDLVERIAAAGFDRHRLSVQLVPSLQMEAVIHALGAETECLIVMSRDADPASGIERASRAAATRHVTVLLVAPPEHAAG